MPTYSYSSRITGVKESMRLVVDIQMNDGRTLDDAQFQQEFVTHLRNVILAELLKLDIPADLEEV